MGGLLAGSFGKNSWKWGPCTIDVPDYGRVIKGVLRLRRARHCGGADGLGNSQLAVSLPQFVTNILVQRKMAGKEASGHEESNYEER